MKVLVWKRTNGRAALPAKNRPHLDEFGEKFKDGNVFLLVLTALSWELTKYR
jgi:hypothetical protein